MNSSAVPVRPSGTSTPYWPSLTKAIQAAIGFFSQIPASLIALLGRFSIAALFWKAGQTKVEGFAMDFISGEFSLGLPRLADSAVALFRDEYRVPLIAPELAAPLTALAEHSFSILILIGLATRFSALALLGMVFVIQTFVYPDAYPTHGIWAAVLLYLIAKGPGVFSVDHWIAQRYNPSPRGRGE